MSRPMIGIPSAVLSTPQERKLFTFTYTASGNPSAFTDRKYSPEFPRSLFSKLIVRLSGTLTKTESAPGTLSDNILSLIRSIRILGDGDLLKEFEPRHMRVLSHHVYRGQDTNVSNITLGSDTAETFSARLEIDFQLLRTFAPWAGWFPAYRYNQCWMEIDWGAFTDIAAGGTYTGQAFAGPTVLDVFGEEMLDPGAQSGEYLIHKVATKTNTVSSTAETLKSFPLPVGEAYRGILLWQGTRSPDLSISTLITSGADVQVWLNSPAGSFMKYQSTWSEITQRNQARYGVAMPTGYAFIDFCEDGDLQKSIRTENASSFELRATTASVANAQLQIIPVTLKGAPSPL